MENIIFMTVIACNFLTKSDGKIYEKGEVTQLIECNPGYILGKRE